MDIKVKVKEKAFEEAVAKKNLSYLQLAEMTGVNKVYLSNVKNEKLEQYSPSPKLRQKLMEILEVEFDEIFEIIDS